MGCIASKEIGESSPREKLARKGSLDRRVAHVNSSRKDEGNQDKEELNDEEAKVGLIEKQKKGSNRFNGDSVENEVKENYILAKSNENCEADIIRHRRVVKKKVEKRDVLAPSRPGSGRVPNSLEGEQVAAGWPSWLASTAGECIRGWVPRQANTFEKLDRIGQGTYSNVYRARDLTHDRVVALKKVRFDNADPDSVKFMAREILILRRLNHPNIIKLEGLITSQTSSSLYLVFEYMEHDLTGLASIPGIKFTEPQIKCYMRQLFSGLEHCHSNGTLHRDIKGSNLLIDDNGILKIADFGLASFFDPQNSAQLTSRVVTLWYRAPELLLGTSHYGVAVDMWSTGCILGELYSGKPILPGRTEVEQLHRIFKLCGSPNDDFWMKSKLPHTSVIKPQRPYRRCVMETYKDLPSPAVELLETLLSVNPSNRGDATSALKSEFFTTKPLACDPSSLPKYPPSKEIDAKMRDEEARRQRMAGSRKSGQIESINAPAPKPNNDSTTSVKLRSHSNSKGWNSNSEKEKTASGRPIDPFKQTLGVNENKSDFLEQQRNQVSHSGPLVHSKLNHSGPLVNGMAWRPLTKTTKDVTNHPLATARANLSAISGLVAARTSVHEDYQDKHGTSQPELIDQVKGSLASTNRVDYSRKQGRDHQIQKIADSPHANVGKSSTRERTLQHRGPNCNKIYVSGPLLGPSNNMEKMIQEHDRQIQEFARQRRQDKAWKNDAQAVDN